MSDERTVEVVHRLARRVHLRVPALARQRAASHRIADRLAGEFEGHRIRVRPQTGSVIADVEEGSVRVEAMAESLGAIVAEERDDDGRPLLRPRTTEHGKPTDLARAIMEAARGLNEDVRAALDGKADLATLAPFLMGLGSAFQVVRRGEIPRVPWYNLLWYSLRSFLSFNPETTPVGRPSSEEVIH